MIFYFICIPNTCQKVDLNLIVLNNVLIRNFMCFLQKKKKKKKKKKIILLHIASVQVSDDLFHNFCDSFRTK